MLGTPTPASERAHLSDIAYGFMASKALFAALELDLFTDLAQGPRTCAELSASTRTTGDQLQTLLHALKKSLGRCTPAERFATRSADGGSARDLTALAERRIGDDWISRRVASNGVISVSWQQFSVDKHHGGELVDVYVTHGVREQPWADSAGRAQGRRRQGSYPRFEHLLDRPGAR
jgi:hypothetical protein